MPAQLRYDIGIQEILHRSSSTTRRRRHPSTGTSMAVSLVQGASCAWLDLRRCMAVAQDGGRAVFIQ
jgi:hypothetical protein